MTETTTKLIDAATKAANGPKHALMDILNNLERAGLHDAGICLQLRAVIRDLEEWQNR